MDFVRNSERKTCTPGRWFMGRGSACDGAAAANRRRLVDVHACGVPQRCTAPPWCDDGPSSVAGLYSRGCAVSIRLMARRRLSNASPQDAPRRDAAPPRRQHQRQHQRQHLVHYSTAMQSGVLGRLRQHRSHRDGPLAMTSWWWTPAAVPSPSIVALIRPRRPRAGNRIVGPFFFWGCAATIHTAGGTRVRVWLFLGLPPDSPPAGQGLS